MLQIVIYLIFQITAVLVQICVINPVNSSPRKHPPFIHLLIIVKVNKWYELKNNITYI